MATPLLGEASIIIDQATLTPGVAGYSRDDGVVGQLVTLRNANAGNENVKRWQWILQKPRASAAVLSAPNSASCSFTPDSDGTYAVILLVNEGIGSLQRQRRQLAVKSAGGFRYPAQGESNEANWTSSDTLTTNETGWWEDMDRILRANQANIDGTLLTVDTDLGLINSRRLQFGPGIASVDGGPGGDLTISASPGYSGVQAVEDVVGQAENLLAVRAFSPPVHSILHAGQLNLGADGVTSNNHAAVLAGSGGTASGSASVVVGGTSNVASGAQAAVLGGSLNDASGDYSVIGAGTSNVASGNYAAVAGGGSNLASALYTSIAGGQSHTASGSHAAVCGGFTNTASGPASVVAGGSTNTASGENSAVSGGQGNTASGEKSAIAGGGANQASADNSAISGGDSNVAAGVYCAIGGGQFNSNSGDWSTIAGGRSNAIPSSESGTISGGRDNAISGDYAAIGGGQGNQCNSTHAVVAGGSLNLADNTFAAVGGGETNEATATHSTIAGGQANLASGAHSAVGGGSANIASSTFSTVAGGRSNTASGIYSAVLGGIGNNATGDYSVVVAGRSSDATASDTVALGRAAVASHAGAVVMADGSGIGAASSAANQLVQAFTGGIQQTFVGAQLRRRACSSSTNYSEFWQGQATTGGAVLTTASLLNLPSGQDVHIRGVLKGKKSTTSDACIRTYEGMAVNVGGVITTLTALTNSFISNGGGNLYAATVGFSATTFTLSFQGVAATTVYWTWQFELFVGGAV